MKYQVGKRTRAYVPALNGLMAGLGFSITLLTLLAITGFRPAELVLEALVGKVIGG